MAVLSIEVDHAWNSLRSAWGVSTADQFVWLAWRLGYDVLVKVPCAAKSRATAAMEGGQYSHAAWLAPLADASTGTFRPSGLRSHGEFRQIVELLAVDRREGGLAVPSSSWWGRSVPLSDLALDPLRLRQR